jgi:hypothetical protein
MGRLSIFVATLVAASVAVLSFPPSTASDAGRPPARNGKRSATRHGEMSAAPG